MNKEEIFMLYYVRKAKAEDLETILLVIEDGRNTLNQQNIPQWRNNDGPNRKVIIEDIHLEEGYVLIEDNEIVGYGTITKKEQASYDEITNGDWLASTSYVSLHRVVIHSRIKQRGMSQFFLGHLISFSKEQGFNDIRIDTHPVNSRMRKVIEKAGFSYRGDIILPVENGEREAFQILLEN